MAKLTFKAIHKIVQGNGGDLKGDVTLQFITFNENDGGKIFGKGSLSCGNYSIIGVITQKSAEETKSAGLPFRISSYDVIKFSNYKLNNTKDKKIIIINGVYQIVKTGVKSQIGKPISYYD